MVLQIYTLILPLESTGVEADDVSWLRRLERELGLQTNANASSEAEDRLQGASPWCLLVGSLCVSLTGFYVLYLS